MSRTVKSEVISRRTALSFVGLAALSLAVPTVLTVSDAEAQTAAPPAAPTAPMTGTERRQERRTGRTERRQARRTGRTKRRQERRTGGTETKTETK
jgi:hypothetical protein